jgi:hypothetical protein
MNWSICGVGALAALRTWLWSPLAALGLVLAGCGGGGGSADQPGNASQGCDAATCGTVYVGITDADGDFLSYSVDVVSLTLRKANGAVVETLPVTTRVDFAQLVDLSEFVTAATIPNGAYVEGQIRLDYTNAEVTVEIAGEPRAARVVDASGQPLGMVDLDIRLDNRNHVMIAPGVPAFLQLDFDLAASHSVDISTMPVTAVAEPFIVASVEPVIDKELRVRGPLVSVDTAASSYVIDVRPFHHQTARFGELTVKTTAATAFEIDGTPYIGADGLAVLAQSPAGTPTVAFGTLMLASRDFTAVRVHAGTSVPGPSFDVVWGNVTARDGDTLTVRGATLITRSGRVAFVRADITLLVGPDTRVTRDGQGGNSLTEDVISVGQRIHAFGVLSEGNGQPTLNALAPDAPAADSVALTADSAALTLDATSGRVRLHLTHLTGTVAGANPGALILDLFSIDGRRPAIFDFTGTGAAPDSDADPENYEIATGAPNLTRLITGSPARVFGFVTPFGAAPPDFEGRTVVDFQEVRAFLGIGWGIDGTSAPFLSMAGTGLVIDNANPDIGLRHFIAIGPVLVDLKGLSTPPTVVPADGRALFAIGEPRLVEVFSDFERFAQALSEKLAGGQKALAMSAQGRYDAGSTTFTANYVSVSLARAD